MGTLLISAMSRIHHCLSLLLLCSPLARAEIDWTPRFLVTQAEGIQIRRLYFADGAKKYATAFDSETSARADAGGARFAYEKVPSAVFTIHPQTPPIALPADEKLLAEYRKLALACAPEKATDFQLVEEVPDALPINRWQSLRFIFTYNLYGHRKQHCVTFLTLPNGKQARLETTALDKEFGQAQARSEYIIRSWHELASSDLASDAN